MVYTDAASSSGPEIRDTAGVVATIKNDQSHYWEPIELDPDEFDCGCQVGSTKRAWDLKKPTVHAQAIKTSHGGRYRAAAVMAA